MLKCSTSIYYGGETANQAKASKAGINNNDNNNGAMSNNDDDMQLAWLLLHCCSVMHYLQQLGLKAAGAVKHIFQK